MVKFYIIFLISWALMLFGAWAVLEIPHKYLTKYLDKEFQIYSSSQNSNIAIILGIASILWPVVGLMSIAIIATAIYKAYAED